MIFNRCFPTALLNTKDCIVKDSTKGSMRESMEGILNKSSAPKAEGLTYREKMARVLKNHTFT